MTIQIVFAPSLPYQAVGKAMILTYAAAAAYCLVRASIERAVENVLLVLLDVAARRDDGESMAR